MSSNTDSNLSSDGLKGPEIQAIMNDVATLKHDLAALIRSITVDVTGNVSCAQNAMGKVSQEAVHAYEALAAQGERSVKALSHQVEEQPVKCLLIAFAVGFLGSHILAHKSM